MPMTVTSIEREKKHCVVYLNGEAAFRLYPAEIDALELAEGGDFTGPLRERVLLILIKRAKVRTLHLLDRQDRTEKQLREKLKEELYPEEAIEASIKAAKAGKYLDDRRYACQYALEKSRRKSLMQIHSELYSKGISEELIEEALSSLDDDTEKTLLKKLILKKCPDPSSLGHAGRQKLFRSLTGKGFGISEIKKALEEIK